MAISTLTELKSALQNWTKRFNTLTSTRTGELISLFEASANANIRLRENEIDLSRTATVASASISLPSNFQEPVSLKVTSTQRKLTYVMPDLLPYYPSQGPSNRWTVTESSIKTEYDADQAYAYTLRYHRKYDLNTDSTNSLLTRYPNVYLYGCLLEAAPYVRDLGTITLWQTRYDRAKRELDRAETAYKRLGTLVVDSALISPGSFNINTGL